MGSGAVQPVADLAWPLSRAQATAIDTNPLIVGIAHDCDVAREAIRFDQITKAGIQGIIF